MKKIKILIKVFRNFQSFGKSSAGKVELIKIYPIGKRIFEINFDGKKLMKSISMDFQKIFVTLARNDPKEVELILNMRNGLQFISEPSDGYLTKIKVSK